MMIRHYFVRVYSWGGVMLLGVTLGNTVWLYHTAKRVWEPVDMPSSTLCSNLAFKLVGKRAVIR